MKLDSTPTLFWIPAFPSEHRGQDARRMIWGVADICYCFAALNKVVEMDPRVSSSLEDKNPGEPPEDDLREWGGCGIGSGSRLSRRDDNNVLPRRTTIICQSMRVKYEIAASLRSSQRQAEEWIPEARAGMTNCGLVGGPLIGQIADEW
jgi:hypothetical protein